MKVGATKVIYVIRVCCMYLHGKVKEACTLCKSVAHLSLKQCPALDDRLPLHCISSAGGFSKRFQIHSRVRSVASVT